MLLFLVRLLQELKHKELFPFMIDRFWREELLLTFASLQCYHGTPKLVKNCRTKAKYLVKTDAYIILQCSFSSQPYWVAVTVKCVTQSYQNAKIMT